MPTVFNFPTSIRPNRVDWQRLDNTQVFTSPLSGATQTGELPGAKWMATLRFNSFKRSEIAILESLLAKLRGQANRVLLWNHARENPRGSGLGAPLVKGAAQTGTSILTDGWTISQAGLLLEGDFVSLNGELKVVTADLASDGVGDATLNFEPPIRTSPLDNDPIVITNATSKFMLMDNSQGKMSSQRSLNSVSLTFIEDIT